MNTAQARTRACTWYGARVRALGLVAGQRQVVARHDGDAGPLSPSAWADCPVCGRQVVNSYYGWSGHACHQDAYFNREAIEACLQPSFTEAMNFCELARIAELADPEPDLLPETVEELRKMGMR